MARTAIPETELTLGSGAAGTIGTLDQANGMKYTPSRGLGRTVFRVKNTGSVGTITVQSGNNPPSFRADLGDVDIAISASSGDLLFAVESARHIQSDGDIYLDFTAGMAGSVYAYSLPDEV
jgi:hypothetical protein